MTQKEEQEYDRNLLAKEVKKFKKKLDSLPLKSVVVMDIHLKIEEKKKVFSLDEKKEVITDKRSFADKIMSI